MATKDMAAHDDHLRTEGAQPAGQRLDKWLYFARLAKSRNLAAELVLGGKVRVNRTRAGKPSQLLRPGEVLTIAVSGRVLVLKVLAPGRRRGPAVEARGLYEVLSPTPAPAPAAEEARAFTGTTGRERRPPGRESK
jgi:ribosome-associated heat shock protein Hsp15